MSDIISRYIVIEKMEKWRKDKVLADRKAEEEREEAFAQEFMDNSVKNTLKNSTHTGRPAHSKNKIKNIPVEEVVTAPVKNKHPSRKEEKAFAREFIDNSVAQSVSSARHSGRPPKNFNSLSPSQPIKEDADPAHVSSILDNFNIAEVINREPKKPKEKQHGKELKTPKFLSDKYRLQHPTAYMKQIDSRLPKMLNPGFMDKIKMFTSVINSGQFHPEKNNYTLEDKYGQQNSIFVRVVRHKNNKGNVYLDKIGIPFIFDDDGNPLKIDRSVLNENLVKTLQMNAHTPTEKSYALKLADIIKELNSVETDPISDMSISEGLLPKRYDKKSPGAIADKHLIAMGRK